MIRALVLRKPSKRVLALGNKSRGAAAFMIVVIVLVATLIMATASSRISLSDVEIGFTGARGDEAFAMADGCMEEAMRRMRLDNNFGLSATTTLSYGGGSCTINVTASSSDRTIDVKATRDIYHARLQSEVNIASGDIITVNSWAPLSSQ